MNNKIKELLVDNKDIFSNGVTESNGEVYIHGSQDNLQKFAVLLIKECAAIADETGCGDTTYGWIVGNKITEHFGIE